MTGVEILNQTNIYVIEGYLWIFFLLVGIGFMVGLIIDIVSWCNWGFDGEDLWVILLSTMLGALAGFVCYLFSVHETDKLDYVEYKVTVSDEVNLNEFMDKYEILEQEGKIYVVKEK